MKDLRNFVERCRVENKNMLYAQLRQGGEVVDSWQAFPLQTRLNLMSVSKSIVSVAVGIAEGEGLIRLDEKICEAFPEYVPKTANDFLLNTNLTQMLTMTTGLADPLFFTDSPERYRVKDWIEYFFHANFDHPSGKKFLYSNFNTYIISALIEKRAGQNLLEYLRWRLFEPIGIGNPDWTLCPRGHVYAANGCYMTLDELSRFGQMLLQKGRWKEQTLIPEDYLQRATVKQVSTAEPEKPAELCAGYGYQFWMTPKEGVYMASGNYGQVCLIWPEKQMVATVLSLEGNDHARIRRILLEELGIL